MLLFYHKKVTKSIQTCPISVIEKDGSLHLIHLDPTQQFSIPKCSIRFRLKQYRHKPNGNSPPRSPVEGSTSPAARDAAYRNFLYGRPASSSCICCIQPSRHKQKIDLRVWGKEKGTAERQEGL